MEKCRIRFDTYTGIKGRTMKSEDKAIQTVMAKLQEYVQDAKIVMERDNEGWYQPVFFHLEKANGHIQKYVAVIEHIYYVE